MYRQDTQRGSALLTALIITSAVGLVLASISRFTISEVRSTSTLEDATIALGAAEAGIEDGLLRVRFNRNTELPVLGGIQDMQASVLRSVRVNLTTTAIDPDVTLGQNLTQAPTDSAYDLRIWYKVPNISLGTLKIFKDQTFQIDVSNLSNETLALEYNFGSFKGIVETTMIKVNADGSTIEQCTVFVPSCKNVTPLAQSGAINLLVPGGGADGSAFHLRIKPFIFNLDGTPAADTAFMDFALTPPAGTLVDSGTTFIESTGYFGAAKRTLLAKVDRVHGTVLSVFDFAIFSNQNVGR